MTSVWRRCSSCKKEIGFNQLFYECSVSTCTQKRTGFVFCSVPCWERHLPMARHRDASAVQERSPQSGEGLQEATMPSSMPSFQGGARRIIPKQDFAATVGSSAAKNDEILVVVSKVKDYIRGRSEMNTSSDIMPILSDAVRRLCDEAMDKARSEGRKTVLDRDF